MPITIGIIHRGTKQNYKNNTRLTTVKHAYSVPQANTSGTATFEHVKSVGPSDPNQSDNSLAEHTMKKSSGEIRGEFEMKYSRKSIWFLGFAAKFA